MRNMSRIFYEREMTACIYKSRWVLKGLLPLLAEQKSVGRNDVIVGLAYKGRNKEGHLRNKTQWLRFICTLSVQFKDLTWTLKWFNNQISSVEPMLHSSDTFHVDLHNL